jgi:hypothetical protein
MLADYDPECAKTRDIEILFAIVHEPAVIAGAELAISPTGGYAQAEHFLNKGLAHA